MAHHSDEVTEGREYIQSDSGKLKIELRRTLKFANLCLISLAILTGCASTRVYEIRSSSSDRRLPRPERVFVYDFAVSPEDTKVHGEPSGRLLQDVGTVSQTEEELKVGRELANILAAELVKAIGDLGLPAKRATRGRSVPHWTLVIDGQFVHIDKGSRALRMLIGFGAGGSEVRTLVQVYMGRPRGKILVAEFETIAESSKKPGLGVTMGAGAVVGAISAAGAAAGGAASGVMENKASVEADARRTAKEVAKHLRDLFVRQGWIPSK